MKFTSLLCIALAAAVTTASAGPLTGVLMTGSTNLIPANATTWQVGTIPANAAPYVTGTFQSNTFNLNIGSGLGPGYSVNTANSNAVIVTSTSANNGFIITGAQINTNQLPVYAINTYPGYPNTLYGPMNNISISSQVNLQKTNVAGTGIYTFYWATSNDGSNCVNNAFTQTVTVLGGSLSGLSVSNFATLGTPYVLLQAIVNTNVVPGTNTLIEPSGKAGI